MRQIFHLNKQHVIKAVKSEKFFPKNHYRKELVSMLDNFSYTATFNNIELLCSCKTKDDDMVYDRTNLVKCLFNRKCGHYLDEAITDLDWILQNDEDKELCEWICIYLKEAQNQSKQIICHSPRDAAIQTLLDNAYADCEFCFCEMPV